MDLNKLKIRLKNDTAYSANIELAEAVVKNVKPAVNYYISEICMPISSIIEKKIMHRNIVGEFYEFISSPFNSQKQESEWHKVSLYEGTDCKLSTYTSCITSRHFYKVAKKEKIVNEKESDLLDFIDYESLLKCDKAEENTDSPTQRRMKKAFNRLSNRDQIILQYTIIDKIPSLDTYYLIEKFITPRPKDGLSSEEVKALWDDKRRQDVVSLIKGRALDHLEQLYNAEK